MILHNLIFNKNELLDTDTSVLIRNSTIRRWNRNEVNIDDLAKIEMIEKILMEFLKIKNEKERRKF